MDKQTESRKAFEDAWIKDNTSTPGEAAIRRHALSKSWVEEGQFYFDSIVMLAWKWWQLSRESLVVELPTYMTAEEYQSAGYNNAIDDCERAISAIGIRIKGEGI